MEIGCLVQINRLSCSKLDVKESWRAPIYISPAFDRFFLTQLCKLWNVAQQVSPGRNSSMKIYEKPQLIMWYSIKWRKCSNGNNYIFSRQWYCNVDCLGSKMKKVIYNHRCLPTAVKFGWNRMPAVLNLMMLLNQICILFNLIGYLQRLKDQDYLRVMTCNWRNESTEN